MLAVPKERFRSAEFFHSARRTSWNQASRAFFTARRDLLPASDSTKRVSRYNPFPNREQCAAGVRDRAVESRQRLKVSRQILAYPVLQAGPVSHTGQGRSLPSEPLFLCHPSSDCRPTSYNLFYRR